jgi:hypothetical protein
MFLEEICLLSLPINESEIIGFSLVTSLKTRFCPHKSRIGWPADEVCCHQVL